MKWYVAEVGGLLNQKERRVEKRRESEVCELSKVKSGAGVGMKGSRTDVKIGQAGQSCSEEAGNRSDGRPEGATREVTAGVDAGARVRYRRGVGVDVGFARLAG